MQYIPYFSKDISALAKSIKKQAASDNVELEHSQILKYLAKAMATQNYQDYLQKVQHGEIKPMENYQDTLKKCVALSETVNPLELTELLNKLAASEAISLVAQPENPTRLEVKAKLIELSGASDYGHHLELLRAGDQAANSAHGKAWDEYINIGHTDAIRGLDLIGTLEELRREFNKDDPLPGGGSDGPSAGKVLQALGQGSKNFGIELKKFRIMNQLPQGQLSKELDVSPMHIDMWEKGLAFPDDKCIKKLRKALENIKA